MWLKSFAHAREVREAGFARSTEDGHPDEIRYWKVHQPIVTFLLRSCDVRVACDPARVTYKPDAPAVIMGWACTSPSMVHWVGIKRSVMAIEGEADELLRALVGDLLDQPTRHGFDLMDLRKMRLVPAQWRRDRAWLAGLRQMSQRVQEQDKTYTAAAEALLSLEDAAEWQPRSAA